MTQMTFTINIASTPRDTLYQLIDILSSAENTSFTIAGTPEQSEPAAQHDDAPRRDSVVAPEPEQAITLDDMKKVAREMPDQNAARETLEKLGVACKPTLMRSVSAIPQHLYSAVLDAWSELCDEDAELTPSADADDAPDQYASLFDDLAPSAEGGEDDDFDAPAPQIGLETAKDALRAHAREKGKEDALAIMRKFKCAALADVDKLPADKLLALYNAIPKI